MHCEETDTPAMARTSNLKHYENLPMHYTENFSALKIENFQLKFFYIFLIFAPKRRLLVHVRTTSPRRF